jgi:putative transcriptional regulator
MNAKLTTVSKKQGKTNWKKVRALSESKVISNAQSDSDAPPLSPLFLKKFKRVTPVQKINVKKIRNKLHLSQSEFADYFGVSTRTIQEWEQERRTPTGTARNFLKVIEQEPEAVLRALSLNK